MTGMSIARKTRSGIGVGPGICKKWRPGCRGLLLIIYLPNSQLPPLPQQGQTHLCFIFGQIRTTDLAPAFLTLAMANEENPRSSMPLDQRV
jgi:hypothetical protein